MSEVTPQPTPQPTSILAPEVSPLTEADPNSLNELIAERIDDIFNKPPLSVNDADLRIMVEYYQRERFRFKQESDNKEQRPRATRKKTPTSVADALIASAELL